MIELVDTSIKSFASKPEQSAFVPPQEQIFVLTSDQLKAIISQAVENAVQPLHDRIEALEELTARERAFDRQRISALEHSEPHPLQKDRSKVLRALLAANNGKLLLKDARKTMHLRKDLFSQLLKSCDFIELKPYHLDRRQTVIILKSELV